ncbi:MAG: protein-L-isoaspartate(D-aspartate) O-methyltransferase [Anaerolineae bacterium]|jgi:protein-L-isoaspartate(D-aspartate) O-methyltransferase|nr:protein-L-isoaspartate(D-aspartate) O-methyltransferase [Anaerolineae bacterium]MDH7473589.1 protein-L-isoaspartate(D-aspartate) O-methyltransferase [Anaerolineae bacterium]
MTSQDDLTEYDQAREQMVRNQIEARGIADPLVLAAMRQVPRHLFVPVEMRDSAYRDAPLPIGEGQTISQPYIVALMTEMLELTGEERVLEIGTGSGYQAAVLSLLAREVYTVERLPTLARRAEELLYQLGYHNVHVRVGDGTLGWSEYAPYEAIIVTAASPDIPPPLLDQLADGGRFIAPIGPRWTQTLVRVRRKGDKFHREHLTSVAFVPLVGEHGWNEGDSFLRRLLG